MMKKVIAFVGLFLLLLCACAEETEVSATDITEYCRFSSSDNMRMREVHDMKIMTFYTAVNSEQTIFIALPDRWEPSALTLDLYAPSDSICVRQYDREDGLLSEVVEADSADYRINRFYTVDASTSKVGITVSAGTRVSEIHVYSVGTLPGDVQNWQLSEKADIMLISTHQDDEELWFGGLLPYYGVEREKSTQVVYMADCGRIRYGEALSGLWAMGLKQYPEFIGLKDFSGTYEQSLREWGGSDEIIGCMVEVIRKYRPEVIVTHDWDGEYGHNQHIITARHIEQAVVAAADKEMYPESADRYGVWQTKKLYLHLSGTRSITMDWDTPCEKLGGLTPYQVAEIGFSKHRSQFSKYNMEKGRRYKNNEFGLVYTVVGDDVMKNDLLENIP